MVRTLRLGRVSSYEVVGPTDIIRPWEDDLIPSLVPTLTDWRVLEPARVDSSDGRTTELIGRWPELSVAIGGRLLRRSRSLAYLMAAQHFVRGSTRSWRRPGIWPACGAGSHCRAPWCRSASRTKCSRASSAPSDRRRPPQSTLSCGRSASPATTAGTTSSSASLLTGGLSEGRSFNARSSCLCARLNSDGVQPPCMLGLVLARELVAPGAHRLDPPYGLCVVAPCRCLVRPAQGPGDDRCVLGLELSGPLRLVPAHRPWLFSIDLTPAS